MGLESTYFINNLGSFFLVVIFDIALVIIWMFIACMGRYSRPCRKRSRKLGKKLFFTSWISMIFASFLMVVLCILISLKYSFNMKSDYGQQM